MSLKKKVFFLQFRRSSICLIVLGSLAFAQSDAVVFTINEQPVTQNEVKLNRLALSIGAFEPFLFPFDEKQISAKKCPITFEERALERLADDVLTAAVFQASEASRPNLTEVEKLEKQFPELDRFFAKEFVSLGLSREAFLEALRKYNGVGQVYKSIQNSVVVSPAEFDFYKSWNSSQETSDTNLKNDLKKSKLNTAFQQWISTARDQAKVSFVVNKFSWWNPAVASIDGVEISLEQLLRLTYLFRTYLFGFSPLDSSEGSRLEMTQLLCLSEQEEISVNPPGSEFFGVTIKTDLMQYLFRDGVEATLKSIKALLLERLIDEAVAQDFVRDSGLPFLEFGMNLVNALGKYQARGVRVTEAEVKAFFAANRLDYTTPKRALVTGFTFSQQKQADRFRAEGLKKPSRDLSVLAQKQNGVVKKFGRVSENDLPNWCDYCLDSRFLSQSGVFQISEVIQTEDGFVVLLVQDAIPEHSSSFAEAKDEVTRDTLTRAREKYGRWWFASERKRHLIVNNLEVVMTEMQVRAKKNR